MKALHSCSSQTHDFSALCLLFVMVVVRTTCQVVRLKLIDAALSDRERVLESEWKNRKTKQIPER